LAGPKRWSGRKKNGKTGRMHREGGGRQKIPPSKRNVKKEEKTPQGGGKSNKGIGGRQTQKPMGGGNGLGVVGNHSKVQQVGGTNKLGKARVSCEPRSRICTWGENLVLGGA